MSDDQLDNDFKNRVSQVFDHYEDDAAAEGWLKLREKYPVEERQRPVVWLWRAAAVAAILLVALSIGLWLNFHPLAKPNIALHSKPVKDKSARPLTGPAIAKNKTADSTLTSPAMVKNKTTGAALISSAIAKNKTSLQAQGPGHTPAKPAQASNVSSNMAQVNLAGAKPAGQTTRPGNKINSLLVDSNFKSTVAYQVAHKAKSLDIIDSAATKTGITPQQATATTVMVQPGKQHQQAVKDGTVSKSMQSLFDNERKSTAGQNTDVVKIKDKKVAFGIYAATFVNYAKGSSKQFNTGAGFTADIKLTQNLSIYTGVSIAQNSLSYNAAETSSLSFPLAASNFTTATNVLPSYTMASTSRDLNASLVGLDVPVDLKYIFNPAKGNTYIAAGLSSGAFINETYNYTYNFSTPNNPPAQQSQDESSHKAFDNFYFARMLNVSFGFAYPLGGNHLVIEPFFKYPLNGLGDQHILFGSGGLNLKFNFDTGKHGR